MYNMYMYVHVCIICVPQDLHSEEQSISFSKNGKHFGKCFVLSPDFRGKVLFPQVTTNNVKVTVNFGKEVSTEQPHTYIYNTLIYSLH